MGKSLRSKVKRAARTELRKKYGPVDHERLLQSVANMNYNVFGVGEAPPPPPSKGFSFKTALSSTLATFPLPANQVKKVDDSMAIERPVSAVLIPQQESTKKTTIDAGSASAGLQGAAKKKTNVPKATAVSAAIKSVQIKKSKK